MLVHLTLGPRNRDSQQMRVFQSIAAVPLALLAWSMPAAADAGVFSEVKVGVLAHDLPILGEQKEHGVDLNGELLFVSPIPDDAVAGIGEHWRWLFVPRPTVGFEANTSGYTSQIYASLTWTVDLDNDDALWPDHTVFFGFSFGPAYNNGRIHTTAGNRLSVGSNLLFHPAVELGVRVTSAISISVYFDHSSNAGLDRFNSGLDNLGMRAGLHF
jgi:lipid A 3-O-deacylase